MSYPQILPLFSPFKAMLHFFKFDVHWCLPFYDFKFLTDFISLETVPPTITSRKPLLALTLHWGIYTLYLLTHFSTLNSQVEFTLSRKSYRTGRLGWLRVRFSGKENWAASPASSQSQITENSRVLSCAQDGGPAACISCCSIFFFFAFL